MWDSYLSSVENNEPTVTKYVNIYYYKVYYKLQKMSHI